MVETLLCRVVVEEAGDAQHAPTLASQRCVDAIINDLDAGTSLEDAITRHVPNTAGS